jgi:hypothetical protein
VDLWLQPTDLQLTKLKFWQNEGRPPKGLVFHSDRGSQYTSRRYRQLLDYYKPALTRKERANNVKKRNYFTQYSEQAQSVLNSLLEKNADAGVSELENLQTIKVYPFTEIG